tara:strand:- start:31 stop:327 length:297 start_codon:yes stop_codon:yes gene_type:complete
MQSKFRPYPGLLLVKVPQSYWDKKSEIILDKATKDEMRKEYISKGDKMEVGPCGDGIEFCRPGDVIAIDTRGSVEIYIDGEVEPYIVIRESQIIGEIL